jgi:predicted CXXCH cytochrome family protein
MKSFSAQSLVLCTAVAVVCFLLLRSSEIPAAQTAKHPACEMCHPSSNPIEGPSLFPAGVDPSSVCLRCHDYRENHHPVFFAPTAPRQAKPGEDFPLYNGEIRCLTCHDPHGGPRFSEPPKLLRGGPYTDRREICFKCHFREKYAEVNPHIMRDASGALMTYFDKPVCLLCHATIPDPSVDRTQDVKFRADVGFLCWRCHPPMPGEFFRHHFLVKPSH